MITAGEAAKLKYLKGKQDQHVSDLIGKTYEEWNCWEPVFINAATGSGKTTFIKEKLLEEARRNNKKILFFVNRNALKQELIRDFTEIQKKKDITFDNASISDKNNDHFTWKKIGRVMIVSYQSARKFFKYSRAEGTEENSFIQDHNYAVFDECHFFMSDAEFNDETDLILDDCINNCKKLTRIYMSATMDQVFNILNHKERLEREHPLFVKYDGLYYLGLFPERLQNQIKEYFLKMNYSNFSNISVQNRIIKEFFWWRCNGFFYCIPEYYSKYNFCFFKPYQNWYMITNIIKKSKEKFLIFVASKKTGDNLQKYFDSNNINSIFMTAGLNASFANIISDKGIFEQKVLIATKVLDNGISLFSNIDEGGVRNIVIDNFFNEIDMKQMLGRLRGQNKVNVYLRETSKNDVMRLLMRKKGILNIIRDYSSIPSISKQIKKLEKHKIPFRDYKVPLVLNELHQRKIEDDICTLNYYIKLFEESDGAIKSYDDIVLAWFGKNHDDAKVCENINDDIRNEYIKIIFEYSILDKADKETYQEYFEANPLLCDTLKGTIFVELAEKLLEVDGVKSTNIHKNSDALKKIKEIIDRYKLPFRIKSKAASNGRTKNTSKSFIIRTE